MKRFRNQISFPALMLLIGSLLTLFGCGSGSTATGPGAGSGTISGMAVKGPVSGATVTAYAITNGVMGMELASATTDSTGNYQMSLGDYAGPVMLKMSGGTYIDEATGTTMPMSAGDIMTALIPSSVSSAGTSSVQITPLTSMAQTMAGNMSGGMTDANISAANAAIGSYFMVSDILHTVPMNPLVNNSGPGSTTDQKNYGMALAAMSQYAMSAGMSSSSSMVTAMMDDASDGTLNGMMGNTTIATGGMSGGGSMMPSTAGTNGMATAMQQFIQSGMNRSGLTLSDMQTLMNSLTSSNGQFSMMGGTGGMITGGTGTNGMITGGTGTNGMMTGGTGTTSSTGTGGMITGGTGTAGMISGGTGSGSMM